MTKVYLAGPFFKPEQIEVLETLEKIIRGEGFELISPRFAGVLSNMDQDRRQAAALTIFAHNCVDLHEADIVIAIIDDRDSGTMWEMGFFYGLFWSQKGGKERKIYTFTNHNYNLNIMLAGCVEGHVTGYDQMAEILERIKQGERTDKFLPDMTRVY
jgi:nucleoside 2-deoxyribosyltransferase